MPLNRIDYTQYINYLIIGYAFVLPLSRAGIVLFSLLLFLGWCLEGKWEKKIILLKKSKVLIALSLFLLFNCLSLLWSDTFVQACQYVTKYWYFLPLIVIFTSIKQEMLSKVLSAFILGMFVSEVLAYGVFFQWWHINRATVANPTPFMHHIEYSVFLAFTALLLLARIFYTKEKRKRILYAIFFTTISGNLFLTAGRTGQLAFLLGLFVVTWLHIKNRFKASIVFIGLVSLLFSSAYYFSQTFHHRIDLAKTNCEKILLKGNYCTSWGARAGAWVVSKEMIKDNILLGEGLEDNMVRYRSLIDTEFTDMKCIKGLQHMHNQYLQILTQTGMIGLFLFLMIFYYIARLQIQDKEYQTIQYVYLSVILFAGISEVILHRQFSMALFALIVGLLLAQERIENEISISE